MPRDFYRGHAFVLWTLAVEQRRTGWLSPDFHLRLQVILLHTCSRYALDCPGYVLMPDHAHFLWLGRAATGSDQRTAMEFFQQHTSPLLKPAVWQRQPHDRVLREAQREYSAFEAVASYILLNPVRAGLVTDWRHYPHLGSSIPGYPSLLLQQEGYWERFWRVYQRRCEP